MHIEVDRFLALTAMLAGFVPTSGPRCDELVTREAIEASEAIEVSEASEARSEASEVRGGGRGPAGARDLERAPGGADGA